VRAAVTLVLLVAACGGEALDVGEDGSPTGAEDSAGQDAAATRELPDWSNFGNCPTTGEEAPQFVGTWEGFVEDSLFNPITAVRLEIQAATDTGVCGKISWGTDTPAPPPLTDPAQNGRIFGAPIYNQPALVEGLTYTLGPGAGRDRSLRISTPTTQMWRGYCAMQDELYYHPNLSAYSCIERYETMGFPRSGEELSESFLPGGTCVLETTHGDVVLPVKRCVACSHMCECNAETCEAKTYYGTSFDLELEQTLDGADVLVSGTYPLNQTLRLERVP
jgi:hypothetical protein